PPLCARAPTLGPLLLPYTPLFRPAGLVYDSGNYEAATEKAMQLFGYEQLRAEQRARRESGDPVQLGIGVSTYTEMCGIAPSRMLDRKSTRLNSSHVKISYAVFCLK